MTPQISVIIPTYNVGKYIDQCIESIFDQTFQDFEIIICDDCSTDDTLEHLEKYKNNSCVKILKNEKNMRQALTRNVCISESKGKYILIQDADDISEPHRMEKLLEAFEDKIDFVGSACYCFSNKEGIFENCLIKSEYPVAKDLLRGIPFVHASILFRKDCLVKVNGYRASKHTRRGEDYDLIMRLYAAGFQGKNIPDLLYGYRINKETIQRRNLSTRIDECYIRYEGYKANHILFPLGWLYIFKPILAYFYQGMKYRKRFK